MLFEITKEGLLSAVQTARAKEAEHFKSLQLRCYPSSEHDITYQQREEALTWLLTLSERFQFYPEAYALAAAILDKFLSNVKAKPRYLRCIALASFYLAAKITEEDEMVPHSIDLIKLSAAGCTTDDVIRMESLILQKLSWNVNLPTSLHFLQLFHAYLMTTCPSLLDEVGHLTPSHQLSILTHKLQLCIMSSEACLRQPSLVALAILSLELEAFRKDWFLLTMTLLKVTKIDIADLISCRESLSFQLSDHYARVHSVYHRQTKRKVHDVTDQDDFQDSIKKLYSEDSLDLSSPNLANEL